MGILIAALIYGLDQLMYDLLGIEKTPVNDISVIKNYHEQYQQSESFQTASYKTRIIAI